MAKPRVFISSTFYDLKHIRSSLDMFIRGMGYEPILSENGNIAYSSDSPLDESCYREATTADMFIIIIGGRYGSEISSTRDDVDHSFYSKYESVTKKELETAFNSEIPLYILVQSEVYSEYKTYLKNIDNDNITYAHVDSINVFKLLTFISSKKRNNPTFQFDKYSQIESWLKEQWAGLFRDMLNEKTEKSQLSALSNQVLELKEVNKTLKIYLETVLKEVTSDKKLSSKIIKDEDKRLSDNKTLALLSKNNWYKFIKKNFKIPVESYASLMQKVRTYKEYLDEIRTVAIQNGLVMEDLDSAFSLMEATLVEFNSAQYSLNETRDILGLPPLKSLPKALKEDE
ncbi:DUF4062 domain-containing protein [Yersinia enterocolitica]|nr:DUF4062 domain-containing protein [Yersinia enterocolitica]